MPPQRRCRRRCSAAADAAGGALCSVRGTCLCLLSVALLNGILLGIWLWNDSKDDGSVVVSQFATVVEIAEACPRPVAAVTESISYRCSEGTYSGGVRQLRVITANQSIGVEVELPGGAPDPSRWLFPIATDLTDPRTDISWIREDGPLPCPLNLTVTLSYESAIEVGVSNVAPPVCTSPPPCGEPPAGRGYGVEAAWDLQIDHFPLSIEEVNMTFLWPKDWAAPCASAPAADAITCMANATEVSWSGADLSSAGRVLLMAAPPFPQRACSGDSGLGNGFQRKYTARETLAISLLAFSGVCGLASTLVWGAELRGRLAPVASRSHRGLAGDDAGFASSEVDPANGAADDAG
eukprot:TRINITY_DN19240_c0_g1_i1.p1 TRINITY_DN19240_c0_g1~~TRINITY_DN19240_c0_g1_i1.p1  ORF type:complete len:351 (+),score=65.47 TRINITY_DN19240_c0_g1_i1:87-1139(+)